jgi:tetratricopeptide (TPR) repeat protein
MLAAKQSQTSRSSSSKQSALSWPSLRPFLWVAVILIALLVLMPFIMQIVAFWKYDTTTSSIADQVKQQADQTQNLLNLLNTFAAIIGVVFAVFAAVTVALGVYGFSTNNGFRDLEKEWQDRLDELAQKSTAIASLENDMQQKNEQLKQLQEESADLRDLLRRNITTAQAQISKQTGDMSVAIKHLSTTRSLVANDARINLALGRILSGSGDYDRAIELLEAAVLIDPALPEVQKELGLAYRRRGDAQTYDKEQRKREEDYKRATQRLREAIRQNPEDFDALAILGGLYRRQSDYRQALEYYQQAAAADPTSSYTLGNVASLAWYLGDEKLAREMFARTGQAAQERLDTLESLEPYWDYFDLGLSQLMLRKTEDAKQSYTKAIEFTPSKVHFEGVLNNLSLLKKNTHAHAIPGIDEIMEMIEAAR